MRKLLSGIALFILAAAPAAPQDKKDRGKTPELTKQYTTLMKSNSMEMKGLLEDIEKGKPEPDLKKRLAKIRETATKARDLKYRKDRRKPRSSRVISTFSSPSSSRITRTSSGATRRSGSTSTSACRRSAISATRFIVTSRP